MFLGMDWKIWIFLGIIALTVVGLFVLTAYLDDIPYND